MRIEARFEFGNLLLLLLNDFRQYGYDIHGAHSFTVLAGNKIGNVFGNEAQVVVFRVDLIVVLHRFEGFQGREGRIDGQMLDVFLEGSGRGIRPDPADGYVRPAAHLKRMVRRRRADADVAAFPDDHPVARVPLIEDQMIVFC